MEYEVQGLVTAGRLRTSNFSKIKIKSSWSELVDTAVIELPRNLELKDHKLEEVVKRGDRVDIHLGYNGKLYREFTGYVRKIERGIPIRLHCEDYAFLLDEGVTLNVWKKASLNDIVKHLCTGFSFGIQTPDINLGKVRIEKGTRLDVLNQIRDKFGFVAYFRHDAESDAKPNLHVGFPYDFSHSQKKRAIFHLRKNVASDSGLKYEHADDIKVTIKAISNASKTAKKVVVEVGSGAVRTRNYMPGISKEELTILANKELEAVKVDAFTGKFKAFGLPFVQHGDIIKIIDSLFEGEDSEHFVDATIVECDGTKIRREITIGKRA